MTTTTMGGKGRLPRMELPHNSQRKGPCHDTRGIRRTHRPHRSAVCSADDCHLDVARAFRGTCRARAEDRARNATPRRPSSGNTQGDIRRSQRDTGFVCRAAFVRCEERLIEATSRAVWLSMGHLLGCRRWTAHTALRQQLLQAHDAPSEVPHGKKVRLRHAFIGHLTHPPTTHAKMCRQCCRPSTFRAQPVLEVHRESLAIAQPLVKPSRNLDCLSLAKHE